MIRQTSQDRGILFFERRMRREEYFQPLLVKEGGKILTLVLHPNERQRYIRRGGGGQNETMPKGGKKNEEFGQLLLHFPRVRRQNRIREE